MIELTPEQKQAHAFIEALRARKENIKRSISFLNNEIVNIDIQIRDLRQSLPALAPEPAKPTRIRKTANDKIAELQAKIAELNKQIEVTKRHAQ